MEFKLLYAVDVLGLAFKSCVKVMKEKLFRLLSVQRLLCGVVSVKGLGRTPPLGCDKRLLGRGVTCPPQSFLLFKESRINFRFHKKIVLCRITQTFPQLLPKLIHRSSQKTTYSFFFTINFQRLCSNVKKKTMHPNLFPVITNISLKFTISYTKLKRCILLIVKSHQGLLALHVKLFLLLLKHCNL